MVYLIDDSSSQGSLRQELERIFLKLLAVHKTTPDVRVLALKHGGNIPRTIIPLTWQEQDTLGTSGGIAPYLFDRNFKEPKDLPPKAITDAVGGLALNRRNEYLYPAVDKALRDIEGFCSYGDPWCDRKIVVVLGDGRPGRAHSRYFDPPDGIDDEIPEKLLRSVKRAGVELHTICMGPACNHEIIRVDGLRYYYDKPTCPVPPSKDKCLDLDGSAVMGNLAFYTNGTYYFR